MANRQETAQNEPENAPTTGIGRPVWFYLTLLALISILATRAWAAGDPDRGHALARTWCTGCHTVDANGPAKDTAPSFASVAAQNDPGRRAARAFLNAPHPPMPNFNLARSQIDDIVAYLDSLAPHR